ncbi:Protein phosphatase [Candida maltosa Xu316]|uniref:Tyrosine-protein phosphatase CDC14 n=1 Tax=Candida maltosa (strain Xu316) TaxID=1245528 RepID=M3IHD8_CANMX|nr:Protein phosphatase [Candida maltosa Xu316]
MRSSKVDVPLIEFLKRIYLGAYDVTRRDTDDIVFFSVEEELPYNAFYLDFGPLNIGLLYRFAVLLHNVLNDDKNQGKGLVLYSSTDPKHRANTACLLCCYMILIQNWAPHQVLQPIAQINPPLQPFRDAGYSSADYEITIQDIVYAMWRAKERGMIDLTTFDLEEYEQYERVDEGDFNVISKDFIAFASPQQSKRGGINEPFQKVLDYFVDHNVQLVVRLNSHLYDAKEFTKRNIKHIDMIFDDGTCPTLEYVQKFIGAAECIINKGGKIAVHCKAGLGRTGCLIGAHLIYTHGFTANECIAYMRMIRPGMVVGPQQHWLYLHQDDFRTWRHTMIVDNRPDEFIGGLYPLCSYDDYKQRLKEAKRKERLQLQQQMTSPYAPDSSVINTPIRRRKISGALASKIQTVVPMESPGQPRKYIEESDEDEDIEEVDMANNSDEEGDENTMQDIIQSSPARYGSATPNRKESSDWRVLRSISTNSATGQPVHVIQKTTKINETLSSPPGASPTNMLKVSKTRSKARIASGNTPTHRVHSGGIRKVSGKKL